MVRTDEYGSCSIDVEKHPHAETECANSLFEQPWWLDAVVPGCWQDVQVRHADETIARLPFRIRSRCGISSATNPPLTQTLGPWLRPSQAKYVNRLSEETELLTELIRQLPACDVVALNLAPTITNPLPFFWNGFDSLWRCTYRLDDLRDRDRLWSDFSEACRRAIRKAQHQVVVRSDMRIEDFLPLVEKTWKRQGMHNPYDHELIRRLDSACAFRGARKIFWAEDSHSRIHAAIYIVWDHRIAYYLLGGGDPELRSSGAHSLLLWEAICFASSVSRAFDFEGSMNKNIERFFRGFGARQIPILHVRRLSRRMAALTTARQLAEACTGRRLRWFF